MEPALSRRSDRLLALRGRVLDGDEEDQGDEFGRLSGDARTGAPSVKRCRARPALEEPGGSGSEPLEPGCNTTERLSPRCTKVEGEHG